MNIQTMVNRFLGWTLPTDFSPDAGISFKPSEWVHAWPTGTNLFTAEQATAMFEYVLAHDIEDAERASEPIPMVLHCPSCGLQHIDAPDAPGDAHAHSDGHESRWNNPPHRSHLCHGCGTIWRPADVPTVGVESIQTRGKADKIIHAERARVPGNCAERVKLAIEHGDTHGWQTARSELLGILGSDYFAAAPSQPEDAA